MGSRLALVALPNEKETVCGNGPRFNVPPWGKGRFFPSTVTERISSKLVVGPAEGPAKRLLQPQSPRSKELAIFAKWFMGCLVLAPNLATNASHHNWFQKYIRTDNHPSLEFRPAAFWSLRRRA